MPANLARQPDPGSCHRLSGYGVGMTFPDGTTSDLPLRGRVLGFREAPGDTKNLNPWVDVLVQSP